MARSSGWDRRAAISIAARILAATAGAYGASYCGAAALARLLPIERSEAVILSSMIGLLLIVGFAIWSFACRSVWRLWISLGATMLCCAAFGFGRII